MLDEVFNVAFDHAGHIATADPRDGWALANAKTDSAFSRIHTMLTHHIEIRITNVFSHVEELVIAIYKTDKVSDEFRAKQFATTLDEHRSSIVSIRSDIAREIAEYKKAYVISLDEMLLQNLRIRN